MSARRQARGRNAADVVLGEGRVPRVFLLGRCIEVWAADPDPSERCARSVADLHSAKARFRAARAAWLEAAQITATSEQCKTIPAGAPYSVTYLTAHGRAEQAEERLARADCRPDDIPRLRQEAQHLIDRSN